MAIKSSKATPSVDILAVRMVMLGRKLDRAQTLSSRLEELLDDAVRDLGELGELPGHANVTTPGPGQPTRHLRVTRRTSRFPKEPVPGVVDVNVVPHADGSATVQFDGRPGIVLPPLEAAMLEILKADGGIGRDHLVGWKSVVHIQSALKERTKQQHSKAAIKELVFRLRRLLEFNGENPFLVQSNRRLGYRLAIRCAPGPVAGRDNQ